MITKLEKIEEGFSDVMKSYIFEDDIAAAMDVNKYIDGIAPESKPVVRNSQGIISEEDADDIKDNEKSVFLDDYEESVIYTNIYDSFNESDLATEEVPEAQLYHSMGEVYDTNDFFNSVPKLQNLANGEESVDDVIAKNNLDKSSIFATKGVVNTHESAIIKEIQPIFKECDFNINQYMTEGVMSDLGTKIKNAWKAIVGWFSRLIDKILALFGKKIEKVKPEKADANVADISVKWFSAEDTEYIYNGINKLIDFSSQIIEHCVNSSSSDKKEDIVANINKSLYSEVEEFIKKNISAIDMKIKDISTNPNYFIEQKTKLAKINEELKKVKAKFDAEAKSSATSLDDVLEQLEKGTFNSDADQKEAVKTIFTNMDACKTAVNKYILQAGLKINLLFGLLTTITDQISTEKVGTKEDTSSTTHEHYVRNFYSIGARDDYYLYEGAYFDYLEQSIMNENDLKNMLNDMINSIHEADTTASGSTTGTTSTTQTQNTNTQNTNTNNNTGSRFTNIKNNIAKGFAQITETVKNLWLKFTTFILRIMDKFRLAMDKILFNNKKWLEDYKTTILDGQWSDQIEYKYTGDYIEGINRCLYSPVPVFNYERDKAAIRQDGYDEIMKNFMAGKSFQYKSDKDLAQQFKDYFIAAERGESAGKFSNLNKKEIYDYCYNYTKILDVIKKDQENLKQSGVEIQRAFQKLSKEQQTKQQQTQQAQSNNNTQQPNANPNPNPTGQGTTQENAAWINLFNDEQLLHEMDIKNNATGTNTAQGNTTTNGTNGSSTGNNAPTTPGTPADEVRALNKDMRNIMTKWTTLSRCLITAKLTSLQFIAKEYMQILRAHVDSVNPEAQAQGKNNNNQQQNQNNNNNNQQAQNNTNTQNNK